MEINQPLRSSIIYDFDKSQNPVDVFINNANIMSAIFALDKVILKSLGHTVTTRYKLKTISFSSINSIIDFECEAKDKEQEVKIDDSKKESVFKYLVKSKLEIFNFIDRVNILTKIELEYLRNKIFQFATKVNLWKLNTPQGVPLDILLNTIFTLSISLSQIAETESIRFESKYGSSTIKKKNIVSNEIVQEIINPKEYAPRNAVLLVKKPDYLGDSQWEFKLQDRAIRASFSDIKWLHEFHNGLHYVRPGDSLNVTLKCIEKYNELTNEKIDHYTIECVNKIIKPNQIQLSLTNE